jgi:hypothetical protein
MLKATILELALYGIGLHHAGLALEDRRLSEALFAEKTFRVMVATSVRSLQTDVVDGAIDLYRRLPLA